MHLKSQEPTWRGQPLPRGRHKLGAETVRGSQRDRLLRATIECVAEYGFEDTTVPKVVATARVSGSAFYEFFSDKAECFLAACDEVAAELWSELVSLSAEPNWVQAMRKGTGIYLRWWADRPAFARAYLLSIPTVGARAADQRARTYELFQAMFEDLARRARAEQPSLPALSPLTPRILVLAITELVAEEVRAGRVERLPELEDELTRFAIRLLADDATAQRAMESKAAVGT